MRKLIPCIQEHAQDREKEQSSDSAVVQSRRICEEGWVECERIRGGGGGWRMDAGREKRGWMERAMIF